MNDCLFFTLIIYAFILIYCLFKFHLIHCLVDFFANTREKRPNRVTKKTEQKRKRERKEWEGGIEKMCACVEERKLKGEGGRLVLENARMREREREEEGRRSLLFCTLHSRHAIITHECFHVLSL